MVTHADLKPLHAHQGRALDGLRASLRSGHKRPLLALSTGAGKTVISAHIVDAAREKRKRLCFCVPSIGLIEQTIERFIENGIDGGDIGVIQSDHAWRRPHAPIQIATPQTLAKRELPAVDLVVIDECHERFRLYDEWIAKEPTKVFVGLSATPWSKGLGRMFDDLVKPVTMAELIAGGFLSPPRMFAPSHPDLREVKIVAGEYREDELAIVMGHPKLIGNVVTTWLEKAEGRPTLCFAVNRQHAAQLHEEFEARGVPSAYIDAFTDRDERERIGRRLNAGDVKVVCNIGTCTTGIDWDVRCVVMARPTKSEILLVQAIGRGLRTAPGKSDCLVFDHGDSLMRLGSIVDIDKSKLSMAALRQGGDKDEPEERKIDLPWCCETCTALVPAGMVICQDCGHARRRSSGVTVGEGHLQEYAAGELPKAGKAPTATAQLKAMGKASIYAQLKWYIEEKGWSEGRAAWAFKSLFEVWPNHWKNEPTEPPTAILASWIKSRGIAYAKSRGRAH